MDINIQNTCSSPRDLRITDMQICEIHQRPNAHWINYIIRIDTNQGVSGYGEVRDGASALYAKMLKRVPPGREPLQHRQDLPPYSSSSAARARQAGGVCGGGTRAVGSGRPVAYGIPVWQMLGGQFRDKVRMYCDTDVDGKDTGLRPWADALHEARMQQQRVHLAEDGPGHRPAHGTSTVRPDALLLGWLDEGRHTVEMSVRRKPLARGDPEEIRCSSVGRTVHDDQNSIAHPFTGIHVTKQGSAMCLEERMPRTSPLTVIGYDDPAGHRPLRPHRRWRTALRSHSGWTATALPGWKI